MKHQNKLAIASLILLPLVWLLPCVFGNRQFVPYDVTQYPPMSFASSAQELQDARAHSNYDVTEVPIWFLPELTFAGEELSQGRLPTWNPHARTGAPLHAHGLIGLLYPPNWLALVSANPGDRLGWIAWANLAIGGLLAFGLFRQLGFALLPAWIGAALFQLSGPMAANSFFWMRLASFIWLPGILWAMVRIAALERLRLGPILALGAAFAMTWFGGFPPFAATATVFAGVAFAWLVIERWRTENGTAAIRLAAMLFAGLALGALWAMPQVLPSLAFFPESARPPTPLWRDISGQAFERYGLLGYLMPDAFGHPSLVGQLPYKNSPMQLWLNNRLLASGKAAEPNYNYTEYQVFVSTFGVVLAMLGAVFAKGQRAWLARAALLLALGLALFWPGFQLLFHLPVVQNVWPFRWLAGGTLFVAWLAAAGVARLQAHRMPWLIGGATSLAVGITLWLSTSAYAGSASEPQDAIAKRAVAEIAERFACQQQDVINFVQDGATYNRFELAFTRFAEHGMTATWWLLAVGAALFLVGAVNRSRWFAPALAALAAAAIVQLAWHGQSITHGAPRDAVTETEAHAFLRSRAGTHAARGGFTIARAASVPGLPSQLPPGQLMHRGIRDLNFYSHADRRLLQPLRRLLDGLSLPPGRAESMTAKGFLTTSLPADLLTHPWFDLIGLRYVLTTQALPQLGERVGPQLRGANGELYLYERETALPRAFVVHELQVVADDDAVQQELVKDSLQPAIRALLTTADAEGLAAVDERGARPVTFLRDDATEIELAVPAGPAGFLILGDTYLPGWTAQVDDDDVVVHRCNHSQRLVPLPANACRVTFTYHAPGLTAGLLMAAFATLLAIAAAVFLRRRARAQATA